MPRAPTESRLVPRPPRERRARAEHEPVGSQNVVEVIENHSGFHDRRSTFGIDLEDLRHVSRDIYDETGADALPGEARSRSAGDQWDAVFGRELYDLGAVAGVRGPDHPQRKLLVDGGVGGVEHLRGRVRAHLAFDVHEVDRLRRARARLALFRGAASRYRLFSIIWMEKSFSILIRP